MRKRDASTGTDHDLPWHKLMHRLLTGLLGKDQSIATGLLIGLIIWTLTRLVDGVTTSGSIEYSTKYSSASLANGAQGERMDVRLTNLSRDTAIPDLQAVISDPNEKTNFSVAQKDSECVFEPPAWADKAVCDPHPIGLNFSEPLLVPGTYVQISIKYTQAAGAVNRPIVRINPSGTIKVQLIQPGIQTFVVRHEVLLLIGLLAATLTLFGFSVAAGARSAVK
jgi:hypothetical protein